MLSATIARRCCSADGETLPDWPEKGVRAAGLPRYEAWRLAECGVPTARGGGGGGLGASLPRGIMPVKPEDKERAKQKAMEAADAAKIAAEAGKEEGKKKMGYLSRGLKAKYMEKMGDTNLPPEEERRRAEYMQPLLDGLKISKNHYLAVVEKAEVALANAKAAAAASTDFALGVCNAEYLKVHERPPIPLRHLPE